MSEKIVLIDGHSILNRAYYGLPHLTNSKGQNTGAVYGFLNIMFKILDEEHPEYLAVAFDVHAPTFRHEIYKEYKGTRKPMDPELREQVPMIKQMLLAMGISIYEKAGLEADDILGTISKRAENMGMDVRVISGDRDLLQLATNKTMIRIPKTKAGRTEVEDYFAGEVEEKYGVTPVEFIDMKALMGDSSDNIPGVPGIGEKTAGKIIAQFQDVENAYKHAGDIKPARAGNLLRENIELARLSKVLATINTDADIDFDIKNAGVDYPSGIFTEDAYILCREFELKRILTRFEDIPRGKDPAEKADISENFKTIESLFDAKDWTLRNIKAGTGRVSVYFLAENKTIYGAAICTGDETAYIKISEETKNEQITFDFGGAGGDSGCGNSDLISLGTLSDLVSDILTGAEFIVSPCVKEVLKNVSSEAAKQVVDEKRYADTTIAAYLLNPLKSEYPCDDIAKEYLGMLIPAREDLLGKLKIAKAAAEKPEAMIKLACFEAYISYASYEPLMNALLEAEMKKLYDEIEMPLVPVLAGIETLGMRIDACELNEYGKYLSGELGDLEKRIYAEAGEEFNINSPKQLGVVLFEKLGLKGGKKTKTGYSTAADVLEKLAPESPVVSDILKYRQLSKLKSTYADGLAGYIDPDGRIRTTLNQTVTATGRLSSTEPNLQNIPVRMEAGRLFRKVFIPKDGCVFVDADYSQIELRVLAHMSGDENLINAYKEAEDIHAITASKVFHVSLPEVTPELRRRAKAVNFGIVYGISSFGLSQDLSISRKEAQEYIDRYFETYPGIKKYLDNAVEGAKSSGYVTTLYGRRRPIPELSAGNFMQRQFGERVAMNSPIQGTAADIIKIAMIKVAARLERENLKSRIVLQVHDELLVEAYEDEVERVKKLLSEEMRGAADLSVELAVEVGSGENWLDAH